MNKSPKTFSVFDHIEELQHRLIKSIIAVIVASCFFYLFIDEVFAVLVKPVGKLVFTAPGESFVARVMLTLFGGFFLSLPFVLYQVWKFIAIGLPILPNPINPVLVIFSSLHCFTNWPDNIKF